MTSIQLHSVLKWIQYCLNQGFAQEGFISFAEVTTLHRVHKIYTWMMTYSVQAVWIDINGSPCTVQTIIDIVGEDGEPQDEFNLSYLHILSICGFMPSLSLVLSFSVLLAFRANLYDY